MPDPKHEITPEATENAAADLRSLRLILMAFPTNTVQERRNFGDWMRAIDLGVDALTEKAAILRAKKALGHG